MLDLPDAKGRPATAPGVGILTKLYVILSAFIMLSHDDQEVIALTIDQMDVLHGSAR